MHMRMFVQNSTGSKRKGQGGGVTGACSHGARAGRTFRVGVGSLKRPTGVFGLVRGGQGIVPTAWSRCSPAA